MNKERGTFITSAHTHSIGQKDFCKQHQTAILYYQLSVGSTQLLLCLRQSTLKWYGEKQKFVSSNHGLLILEGSIQCLCVFFEQNPFITQLVWVTKSWDVGLKASVIWERCYNWKFQQYWELTTHPLLHVFAQSHHSFENLQGMECAIWIFFLRQINIKY